MVYNAINYVEVHYDAVNSREVLFDDVTYVSRCYDAVTSENVISSLYFMCEASEEFTYISSSALTCTSFQEIQK